MFAVENWTTSTTTRMNDFRLAALLEVMYNNNHENADGDDRNLNSTLLGPKMPLHIPPFKRTSSSSSSTSSANNNNSDDNNPCRGDIVAQDREVKYVLAVYLGAGLAVLSTVENCAIFYIFLSRRQFRISHLFYFSVLAVFDVFLSLSYIALMTVQAIMNKTESIQLAQIWYGYLIPLFTVSQITITASSFLIVAATFERYSTSVQLNRINFTQRRRVTATIVLFLAATLLRVSTFWEMKVTERPYCLERNHQVYTARKTAITRNWYYKTLWMLSARHLISVIIPFFLVAYMNLGIVRSLRNHRRGLRDALLFATVGEKVGKERRASVRAATRMLILVATSYLLSNLLNVVIVCWENISEDSLLREHRFFYSLSADIICLSKIMAGTLRLPIYVWCNRKVRLELGKLICAVWCSDHQHSFYLQHQIHDEIRTTGVGAGHLDEGGTGGAAGADAEQREMRRQFGENANRGEKTGTQMTLTTSSTTDAAATTARENGGLLTSCSPLSLLSTANNNSINNSGSLMERKHSVCRTDERIIRLYWTHESMI